MGESKSCSNFFGPKYFSTPAKGNVLGRAQNPVFTLDVIILVGFGQAFGDLKADAEPNDYIRSGEEGLTAITFAAALGLTPILQRPPIARLLGPSEKDKSSLGRMMATTRGLTDSRLGHSTDNRIDMLASFTRHGLGRDELFSEAVLKSWLVLILLLRRCGISCSSSSRNPPVHFKL